mmetsp:Transcript_14165/g.27523  ORF Transcript_14165/g.27523 Transcript_14165/m.27523 type:complete len:110 (+) Transcript_14165:1296-1625(+)
MVVFTKLVKIHGVVAVLIYGALDHSVVEMTIAPPCLDCFFHFESQVFLLLFLQPIILDLLHHSSRMACCFEVQSTAVSTRPFLQRVSCKIYASETQYLCNNSIRRMAVF